MQFFWSNSLHFRWMIKQQLPFLLSDVTSSSIQKSATASQPVIWFRSRRVVLTRYKMITVMTIAVFDVTITRGIVTWRVTRVVTVTRLTWQGGWGVCALWSLEKSNLFRRGHSVISQRQPLFTGGGKWEGRVVWRNIERRGINMHVYIIE